MSLLFQPSPQLQPPPLFQPPPPPCVKCGITTVITPAFEGANGFSRFDAQRASMPVRTRSIMALYTSAEPDHGPPQLVP
jgi:hypothetical protein